MIERDHLVERERLLLSAHGFPAAVEDTLAVYRKWLHLPDPGGVLVAHGAYVANRLPGCPVWLLEIGAPGAGKTEPLSALAKLPDAHLAGTLTEASLLSGTPKREKATGAKGGLLREIGSFGVIVAKDFTSVLNMSRDTRSVTLAALREVFDGSWTRHVGTDGGRTLSWQGKVGLVGACTPTIDRAHGVMSAMGERFVFYRLPTESPETIARTALKQSGPKAALMRNELAAASAALIAGSSEREPRDLNEEEEDTLVALATLAARIRSSVERDGYSRDIELIPDPEVPTRLVLVLAQLLAGLDVLGVEREQALALIRRVARDSVPKIRVDTLELLVAAKAEAQTTTAVGMALGYPTTTARRTLEDLAAHGLAIRVSTGKGKADSWVASEWLKERWHVLSPCKSASSEGCSRNSSSYAEREREIGTSDISGTPADAAVSGDDAHADEDVGEDEVERLEKRFREMDEGAP